MIEAMIFLYLLSEAIVQLCTYEACDCPTLDITSTPSKAGRQSNTRHLQIETDVKKVVNFEQPKLKGYHPFPMPEIKDPEWDMTCFSL